MAECNQLTSLPFKWLITSTVSSDWLLTSLRDDNTRQAWDGCWSEPAAHYTLPVSSTDNLSATLMKEEPTVCVKCSWYSTIFNSHRDCDIRLHDSIKFLPYFISNMTGCHRGPKQKLWAGYRAHHHIGVLCAVIHIFAYWLSPASVMHVIFFIVECGIARFLWVMRALCMYCKFGQHPHDLGYLCAKFRFCGNLRCWASPRRKIVYTITHSLNHSPSLFDASGTKAKENI